VAIIGRPVIGQCLIGASLVCSIPAQWPSPIVFFLRSAGVVLLLIFGPDCFTYSWAGWEDISTHDWAVDRDWHVIKVSYMLAALHSVWQFSLRWHFNCGRWCSVVTLISLLHINCCHLTVVSAFVTSCGLEWSEWQYEWVLEDSSRLVQRPLEMHWYCYLHLYLKTGQFVCHHIFTLTNTSCIKIPKSTQKCSLVNMEFSVHGVNEPKSC